MIDLIIIFLLIFFNGFFSMSEVALISARSVRIKALAKKGNRSAKIALYLINNPDTYLSTAQIGITVISILTGIYSGERLSDDFTIFLTTLGLGVGVAPLASKAIIVILATYLQCELGELFPKRIGIDKADTMALLTAPIMRAFSIIVAPFVWLLSKNTKLLIRLFHLKSDDTRVTEEEVKSVIRESKKSGEVQEVEQDIMERALVLGDQKVSSIMTHRSELAILDINMNSSEIEQVIRESTCSFYPVIDGDLENIKGVVNLKDLVFTLGRANFSLSDLLHHPNYLPETMTVYRALEILRERKINRALVCDEFGSIVGIISFADIFEGLVGSLQTTEDIPDILERTDKKSWVVDGQCLFYDFLDYFEEEDLYTPDYTTISGLLLDKLGHIPTIGERFIWSPFIFKVMEMDGTRIAKLLVKKIPKKVED